MHRFAYILPIATSVGIVVWREQWEQAWIYLFGVALCELILYLVIHRASRQREFLSAFSLNVQHHEPWVERVVTTETYTDSRGKTHTRTRVHYISHPDRWLMEFNTGYVVDITPETYTKCILKWQTQEEWINPPHINCVSGGGGQLYKWNKKYKEAFTATYSGLYINYIKNSRSIFRFRDISDEEAATLGLVRYPSLEGTNLDIPVVLCSPKVAKRYAVPKGFQRALQLVNAFNGERRQIHIFVILFDASQQPLSVAMEQRAYWEGGNKNEFTLCLGLDLSQEGQTPRVSWSKAFSWCDVPRLESASESWFISHPELDLEAYAEWLRENISLWKRKQFKDFKYLGIRLSPARTAIVYVVALILSATIFAIALWVDESHKGNKSVAREYYERSSYYSDFY